MQQFSHTLRHHYHLHDCIATTDRGAVYYAERHDDQTPVAVKMLAVDQQADPQWLKRFQMEAVIAFRLKHERIVPLLDYWSDDDGVWLVMRWMAGGSLRQRLKTHGAMSPEEVLVMLQDLCGALARAHQHHIVHRDIKPDNILFDEAGNAYLTDFGVAKRLKAKDITEPDATVGSPAYYSPEQIRKLPITPQTDIYALGMVTYEALMNEHPYGNYMRSMQVIMKHLHEDLPALALPKAKQAGYLTGVLRQATHKEPEQRQNNIIDFLQDFSEAIGVT